LKPEKGNLCKS